MKKFGTTGSSDSAGNVPDQGLEPQQLPPRDIATLLAVMKALRDPQSGCPWDVEQDFRSIAPYTIEEAYEVADAIERDSMDDLREELGDLLLQVVYHAQIAAEADAFVFDDVVESIVTKMIRRHPHVFGSDEARSAGVAKGFWEKIKAEEKRRGESGPNALLADVPLALPALVRALKLQKRAATVGFDWTNAQDVLAKIIEEAGELAEARNTGPARHVSEEFGDLLFSIVNLGRHLNLDPETCLRTANEKFCRRFAYIEARLADANSTPAAASLELMDQLWNEARRAENKHEQT